MKKITLLFAMLITIVSSAWADVSVTWSTPTPMTYNEFVALAGTSTKFGLQATSDNTATYKKWFGFTEATSRVDNITTSQVFTLEGDVNAAKIKRASDGNYLSAAGAFGASPISGLKLANRNADDHAPEFTLDMQISFDNVDDGYHYNANSYNFAKGTGGWSTYVAFQIYTATSIQFTDEDGNALAEAQTDVLLPKGTKPSIPGYILTTDPTEGAGIQSDGSYVFKFTKEMYAINFSKEATYSTRSNNDRWLEAVGLRINGDDQLLETGFTTLQATTNYKDLTSGQKLVAGIGQTVTPIWKQQTNAMRGWVYIDLNNDGDFEDEGERVSGSTGNTWNGITTSALSTSGSFVIPEVDEGDYHIRFVVAWSDDPKGYSSILNDGGSITDAIITLSKVVENTYKYYLDEQEIASFSHQDRIGEAPDGTNNLPSYVTIASHNAPTVCGSDPATFTYNLQYNDNLPFELGTEYSLTIRDDASPQFSIYVDPADETKVKSIQSTAASYTAPTLENVGYFNWIFGGDFYNGFTIKNVATGKYLTYGDNASPSDNAKATLTAEPNAGAKFVLSIKNDRNCFKIRGTENNTFINKRGDDLATWASSNADGETGSAIAICEALEIVTVNLTDPAGNIFTATVAGKAGQGLQLTGAEGYTLSEESRVGSTITAKITFPFPTSSADIKNPTSIQSSLGESKWCADSNGLLKANNKASTNPGFSNQDNWNWYIYPSLSADGVFTFQIYNVGAGKYIPVVTAANTSTTTALGTEPGSYQFRQVRAGQAGFYQVSSGQFLTINTSGTDQNIWLWSASGSHMGSTMSFPDAVVVTLEEMQARLDILANASKFEIIEGATVISPSEYAAPVEINAAIDAAGQIDRTDGIAIENFLAGAEAAKINTFINASTSYGQPLTTNYVAKAGYNTVILPVNWAIPSNWTVYSCSEVQGNVLTLVSNATAAKNKPYIIKTDADETFQFIGYSNGADLENVCNNGVLSGANIAATAPAQAYVFNGTDRFEKVYEETEVAANQCWVVLESNAAALFLEAQPTPEVPTANMRITSAEWGTFWAPFAVEIPEGVKAYTGEMRDGWIKMTEVEDVIPARTGVVVTMSADDLDKREGGVFTADLQAVESEAAALETCYTGNENNYNVTVEQGAYLLQKQEEQVGWYKVTGKGFTLAPNRCYLAADKVIEANAESRTFIGFEPVDGDATGISTIASQAATKADGKYMVNGQIVVVKSGKAYNVNGTQVK